MSLPPCTLCPNTSDPRWSLMTKEGDIYELCDGCAPDPGSSEIRTVADRCRALGPPFGNSTRVPKFGVNEPAAQISGKGEKP